LKKEYLAYFLLLAGWIGFCYWLFTHGIWPSLTPKKATEFPVRMDSLQLPLAFTWGSDVPLAGLGFDTWKEQFRNLDSTHTIVVWTGYYFKDEADSQDGQEDLGRSRIKSIMSFLHLNHKRVLIRSLPQEINADVKSNPFNAVGFDLYKDDDILNVAGDTAQICFPIADSLLLPPISLEQLDKWKQEHSGKNKEVMHLIGTADGTGIAESSDLANDRAEMIKMRWMKTGWKEELIRLTTGQRNSPHTLQNRCVMVYFEKEEK
jgi:hypothetical protein